LIFGSIPKTAIESFNDCIVTNRKCVLYMREKYRIKLAVIFTWLNSVLYWRILTGLTMGTVMRQLHRAFISYYGLKFCLKQFFY